MSKFNPGDLALVKTTGESVYVVDALFVSPTGMRILVNLPQLTKEHGIIHGQQIEFAENELETPQERIRRELELRAYELEVQDEIRERIENKRLQANKPVTDRVQ